MASFMSSKFIKVTRMKQVIFTNIYNNLELIRLKLTTLAFDVMTTDFKIRYHLAHKHA